MDIKTHENNFDDIREADRAGRIDKSIKQPAAIREAEKEFKEAADSQAAAPDKEAVNYAEEQFTEKSKQITNAAGNGVNNGIRQLEEIRERRKTRAAPRIQAFNSVEFPEKFQGEQQEEKSDGNGKTDVCPQKIKVKEKNSNGGSIKVKGKLPDFKSGKDIRTGKMDIRTSADEKTTAGNAVNQVETPETFNMSSIFSYGVKKPAGSGKKSSAYTEVITKVLKRLAKTVVSSVVIFILPVMVVLVIIISVLINANDSLNTVGNEIAQLFFNKDDYESQDGFTNRLDYTGDESLQVALGDDSIIRIVNDRYHEKVQEVIDQNSGNYDILNYENIEPDWMLITEVYISIMYIGNNGEFSSGADAETFEQFMWSMVSIEYELKSEKVEAETSDEAELQEAEREQVTLTIYSEMLNIEEMAALYNIDSVQLEEIVSMTDMYGGIIEAAVSELDRFVPEEPDEWGMGVWAEPSADS